LIFLSPLPKKLRDEKKTAANIATITTRAIAHTTLLPVLFPSSAILAFTSPLELISKKYAQISTARRMPSRKSFVSVGLHARGRIVTVRAH
jgi:hypothetical protein